MISKSDPHIAICIPCMDKPHMLFSQSLATLMYQAGRWAAPILLVHQSGSLITRARNQILEQIEKHESEGVNISHLLWLDSDMVFPPNTLYTLRMHDRDIVGCTYVRRSAPFDVHGKTLDGKLTDTSKLSEALLEVAALPGGLMMVKREVYRKLKKPYYRILFNEEHGTEFGEDYVFCAMARAAGYKIYLEHELSKSVGHVSEKVLYPEEDSWPEYRYEMKVAANG